MNYLISNIRKSLRAFTTRKLTIKSDGIPYTFENLSYRKILNACMTEASVYFKPQKPWGMPIHAMIEPSTHCNLRCSLCPVTIGLGRKTGNMSVELFEKFIDEVGEYLFTILLWDWGEPFMNPDIYQMIALAKKKDIKVISSTNGILFKDPKKAEALVKSGIDTIILAIDGLSQETYEPYRKGGSLMDALKGLEMLVDKKKEFRAERMKVVFRFIAMRHNEHEIPELKERVKKLGVDALVLKTLNSASQDPYFEKKHETRSNFSEHMPNDISYRRFKCDPSELDKLRLKHNPCRALWNSPVIHWSGKVCPCTYDPKEKYVLGDTSKSTFKEVWHGEGYREMRKAFNQNYRAIRMCSECGYAYKGGDCSRETMAEVVIYKDM